MEVLLSQFELPGVPTPLPKRYNIAPTQPVIVIVEPEGHREARTLQWGLIPYHARDTKRPLVNVRGETVQAKGLFHTLWKRGNRCLIPATGFYEWRVLGKGRKQPVHIRLKEGRPMAFAGLWDDWKQHDRALSTCTILTTRPNELIESLHDRMPAIVRPEDYERWLSDTTESTLADILRPYPADAMRMFPVSTFVNAASNEGPACIEPVEDEEPTLF